jgi:thymidylate synthase
MEIECDTLDDLLFEVYCKLLKEPFTNNARRSGDQGNFSEVFGVLLELKNPRARISRSDTKGKLFSALGELLWYFAGSEELSFIQYYINRYKDESFDGKSIYGAYGPRLLKSAGEYNQIENVIKLLQTNKTSRRAAIQLFESRDIAPNRKENQASIPCTCTLQFLQREGKLHMITFMRSNDAYLGLPHDIYAFTMIQEFIATSLGLELGVYKHSVGSLHIYETNKQEAQEYICEGLQSTKLFMKPMPEGNQTKQITELLKIEKEIREAEHFEIDSTSMNPYWKDILYLLVFFKAYKKKEIDIMKKNRALVTDPSYIYLLDLKIRLLENSRNEHA